MESTDGSLAWRNLTSSSVLEGFQGQGRSQREITGESPGGNHRGSSPRPVLLTLSSYNCPATCSLRPRPHDFTLSLKNYNNFISRVLYRSLQPQSTNNI